jgi:hypothetical protein
VCPTLVNAEASKLGISGPGKPKDTMSADSAGASISCGWGPSGLATVTASILFYLDQPTGVDSAETRAESYFTQARKRLDDDASDPVTHVKILSRDTGARSVVAAYPLNSGVTQIVLADNAVVTVTVWVKEEIVEDRDARASQLLEQFGPASDAIVGEVVASLR